jgi:uncharacterized protein YciI
MKIFAALMVLALLPAGQLAAGQAQGQGQYVYILRLAPQFQREAAWTETENAVVARHFAWLTEGVKSGQVILVGRTTEPLEKTFGIVIFEADSAAAAGEFMQSDPAVVAGLMTATVHPYSIALQRD